MKPVDFLTMVWGETEGFVDLPAKVNGRWIPGLQEWPSNGAASRRIKSSVRDGEDIYFSPAVFSVKRRDPDAAIATTWLWADLDETHPDTLELSGLMPTVCWRSSPGRYQALWALDKKLGVKVHEELNRNLTYAVGADLSGWDIGQVLRIPGTRNFKYEDPATGKPGVDVRLLWTDGPTYSPKRLWKHLKKVGRVAPSPLRETGKLVDARRADPKIGRRAQRLLATRPSEVVQGERSARLWELECLLVEAGYDNEEIYELIWPCAWNKWAEVRTGGPRLKREILKARSHVEARVTRRIADGTRVAGLDEGEEEGERYTVVEAEETERLPFENYSSFMAKQLEEPRWLINELWSAGSHGIFGGEPKTNKSTLTLALALSVASGKPFLGEYPVATSGPALVIQEENAPWQVQDRLRKLASSYGLLGADEVEIHRAKRGALGRKMAEVIRMPDDVPLFLLNNYGFDLSLEEMRESLEAAIDEIRPVLVVLDPLYLMLGSAAEERSSELRPFLRWLLYLRYTYGCAIAVVHHFRKAREGLAVRPGQRILGSATLHGWVDSAVYCEAIPTEKDQESRVRIEREFRNVGPRKPFEIRLRMGAPGDLRFEAEFSEYNLTGQILALIAEGGKSGISALEVAKQLGVDKRTVLARARGSGQVTVVAGKRGRGHSHTLVPIRKKKEAA